MAQQPNLDKAGGSMTIELVDLGGNRKFPARVRQILSVARSAGMQGRILDRRLPAPRCLPASAANDRANPSPSSGH